MLHLDLVITYVFSLTMFLSIMWFLCHTWAPIHVICPFFATYRNGCNYWFYVCHLHLRMMFWSFAGCFTFSSSHGTASMTLLLSGWLGDQVVVVNLLFSMKMALSKLEKTWILFGTSMGGTRWQFLCWLLVIIYKKWIILSLSLYISFFFYSIWSYALLLFSSKIFLIFNWFSHASLYSLSVY